MRNAEIKQYFKKKNVPMWRVAEKLGMADSSLSRLLRYDISDERKQQILNTVDILADEMIAGGD